MFSDDIKGNHSKINVLFKPLTIYYAYNTKELNIQNTNVNCKRMALTLSFCFVSDIDDIETSRKPYIVPRGWYDTWRYYMYGNPQLVSMPRSPPDYFYAGQVSRKNK